MIRSRFPRLKLSWFDSFYFPNVALSEGVFLALVPVPFLLLLLYCLSVSSFVVVVSSPEISYVVAILKLPCIWQNFICPPPLVFSPLQFQR